MINNFLKVLRLILIFTPATGVALEYQYEDEPEDDGIIPELKSLKMAMDQVRKLKRPLMIEFSTPWCEYCEALEEQVLKPMLINGIQSEKIIVRKLEVDDTPILNAAGQQQTAVDFAMEHDVDLYPTLIFFNGEGKEISKRIVGITTFDYIGEKIDRAIELANQQL